MQTVFDVVYMPMLAVRWFQMVGKSRSKPTRTERTAHIYPISGGYAYSAEFSRNRIEGNFAFEHQGIGAWVFGYFC